MLVKIYCQLTQPLPQHLKLQVYLAKIDKTQLLQHISACTSGLNEKSTITMTPTGNCSFEQLLLDAVHS